jgi:hypothetical protein
MLSQLVILVSTASSIVPLVSILQFHDQINAYKVVTIGQDTRPCGSGALDGIDP